jgi:hypothetical protein
MVGPTIDNLNRFELQMLTSHYASNSAKPQSLFGMGAKELAATEAALRDAASALDCRERRAWVSQ